MKLAVWCVKYMGTLHCISPPSTDTSLRRSRFRCAFLELLSLSLETGTESTKNCSGTSHCNKKMWENLHWKIETCETPILSNPAHTSLQKQSLNITEHLIKHLRTNVFIFSPRLAQIIRQLGYLKPLRLASSMVLLVTTFTAPCIHQCAAKLNCVVGSGCQGFCTLHTLATVSFLLDNVANRLIWTLIQSFLQLCLCILCQCPLQIGTRPCMAPQRHPLKLHRKAWNSKHPCFIWSLLCKLLQDNVRYMANPSLAPSLQGVPKAHCQPLQYFTPSYTMFEIRCVGFHIGRSKKTIHVKVFAKRCGKSRKSCTNTFCLNIQLCAGCSTTMLTSGRSKSNSRRNATCKQGRCWSLKHLYTCSRGLPKMRQQNPTISYPTDTNA